MLTWVMLRLTIVEDCLGNSIIRPPKASFLRNIETITIEIKESENLIVCEIFLLAVKLLSRNFPIPRNYDAVIDEPRYQNIENDRE